MDVLKNSVTDQRAPLLAVLNPSGFTNYHQTNDAHALPRSPPPTKSSDSRSSTGDGERVCETLRENLPSYDSIMKVAVAHRGWWVRIHRAVRGLYDEAIESFPDFVRRVYTSGRPSELGKMAIAFAFSSHVDGSHIYALVDRLVISDMAYMSAVEGLECLILLAILFADEGQPRRSWMIYRRGTMVAQITNLYQAGLLSTVKRRLWLSIYQGDRMMSMFLGLPYGLMDAHYQQILEEKPGNGYVDSVMTIRCAMIAGKVIDRDSSLTKASITKTKVLSEEMDELASQFPDTWWEFPDQVQASGSGFDEIHCRLHQQLFFFHLRLYIYLPLLTSSQERSAHCSIVRVASMDAARQLLRRYLSLHSDAGGPSPSECKLVDFMAFTAAVVLLLGCASSSNTAAVRDDCGDVEAVLSLIRCLQRQENEENCPIASQCRKTLTVLLSRSSTDEEIRIPFFGTVTRKGDRTPKRTDRARQSTTIGSSTGPAHALQPSSSNPENGSAALVSENLALPSSAYLEAPGGMESLHHIPELDFLSHLEDVSAEFDTGWDFIMDLDDL